MIYTIQELQKQPQTTPGGEKRRREAALQWASGVSNILVSISSEEWGRMFQSETVKLTRNDPEYGMVDIYAYFRHTQDGKKPVGFSYIIEDNMIENIGGAMFWRVLDVILEWLPQVVGLMEEKSQSRDALLKMIELGER